MTSAQGVLQQQGGGVPYAGVDPVPAAVARLVARSPGALLPRMHFERDVCLSCDWRRIDLAASSKARAAPSNCMRGSSRPGEHANDN